MHFSKSQLKRKLLRLLIFFIFLFSTPHSEMLAIKKNVYKSLLPVVLLSWNAKQLKKVV